MAVQGLLADARKGRQELLDSATKGAVDIKSLLDAVDEGAGFERIDGLDTTEMVKSYKMLVLLAMLNGNAFPGLHRDRCTGGRSRAAGDANHEGRS